MRIAILTSGILPVPAVLGGAVENLIDFYLAYNEQHHLHDITVYSVWHPDVKRHPALKSKVNHYRFIDLYSRITRIKKWVYFRQHGYEYYHHNIEFFLESAMKHVVRQNFDIIILENRPAFALKLRERTNAKIIFHLHNDKLSLTAKLHREIFDCADRIICVSDFITNQVQSIDPQQKKCITIHNGIDLNAFSHQNSPLISRKQLGLNSQDFVMLFSGRINREKGIHELLEAMMRLPKNHQIKLLVIGSSFYGTQETGNAFIRQLKEMGESIKDQIIFTGFIPYGQMPDYLQLGDISVLPSNWDEPFGLTMAEAQAMGLPIITTRRGGIPEVVSEENAIMLDTDEHFVENLTAAILDLYEHPEKRTAMAEASFRRSRLFDKDTYAKNFFAAIE
jgi:glycosyltransferase involved in cell wall biosynthesis